jgi:branched-chain amino acid transport system substrate-binding protein
MTPRVRLHLGHLAAFALLAPLLTGVPRASQAADPFELNVILPITGAAANLARSEVQSLTALEQTVNRTGGINGRPIKFNILDDQTNPAISVQLANQLIAKNVPIIFGSTLVALCSAMAPLMKNGPVMWCFSNNTTPAPTPGGFVFVTSPTTVNFFEMTFRYFKAKGFTKIAIIAPTDATGQDGERTTDQMLAGPLGRGMTLVAREHFSPADITVAAQVARIKASGAQAIIGWMTGAAFGTVLRGLNNGGVDLPIMTSGGNLTYPALEAWTDFISDNVLLAGSVANAPDRIEDAQMRSRVVTWLNAIRANGIRPDQGHVLAWDAVLLVMEAFRKYGTNATAEQIRSYVAGQKNWVGINGHYNFVENPQRGVGPDAALLVRWVRAKGTWESASGSGGKLK